VKQQATNPFLPSYEYIPDGEPRLFGDRVYLYGSHDRFNGRGFCLNDFVCWSAPKDDLSDWRYEGIIWRRRDDPKSRGNRQGMPAPDCIQGHDGRYYLYYFVSIPSYIGVAVCDTPAGRYQFYGYVKYRDGQLLGYKKGDSTQFDPGVYQEGDKVYLYTGLCPSKGQLHLTYRALNRTNKKGATVTILDKDMVTIILPPKTIVPGIRTCKGTGFEKHPFFEASSLRKINDLYYFIYSSYSGHELCYAISKKPDGDFSFGGTLVSIGDIGLNQYHHIKDASNFTGNTHGSILQLADKFYVFYHRQTNRSQFSRQACAEEIFIDKNGHFKQAEVTSCGLNGKPLSGIGEYESRIACNLRAKSGTRFYLALRHLHPYEPYFTQTGNDRNENPDQYIANMRDGCNAGFKYFDFNRTKSISISTKGTGNGTMIVSNGKKEVASIRVTPSKEIKIHESSFAEIKGIHPLFFKFVGKGKVDFISFTLQ